MGTLRSLIGSWFLLAFGLGTCIASGDALPQQGVVLRIRAAADAWLSDATPRERRSSAGRAPQLKLRNIQELALIRFDCRGVLGREVLGATLFLHRASDDKLRYLRASTVTQDWEEGSGTTPYGPPDGATFLSADGNPRHTRPWAWPGSTVADVIMSAGNSRSCWAERKELDGGWISVELTPPLVYAMAVGDSDGLAVMDGGNPANHDNLISSAQAKGYEPYLEVRLGRPLAAMPGIPAATAAPAPERAHLDTGAIRIAVELAENVFCYQVQLDGKPVDRWRVKHPMPGRLTIFYLEDLEPGKQHHLEIAAVSPGGKTSQPARLGVASSAALGRGLTLGTFERARTIDLEPKESGPLKVWAVPGLVKVSPTAADAMAGDLGNLRPGVRTDTSVNAVWDGRQVSLFGARGEYVSFQLCIENLTRGPLTSIQLRPQPLAGPDGGTIGPENIELSWTWYARNRQGHWQPAYCIPVQPGAPLAIPQSDRRFQEQRNQTVYVDVYVPKDAKPGSYEGLLSVAAAEGPPVEIPIALDVLDFALPDRLGFWPELNAYRIPDKAVDYYRLAHQHRCVFSPMTWRPRVTGRGAEAKVHWEEYDRTVGPLLTGEAFARNRRAGVPVESMYLPFDDNWPTPLSPETYNYQGWWPKKGDDPSGLVEHYLTAAYIAEGLSQEYKDAFLAVQRQFIEHFQEKGYTRTEMQCFFAGKATNRIEFGTNTWWTTDEPYYWDDWLAAQFFLHLWTSGRGSANPRLWAARADVSRPQWQGRTLHGIVDAAYFGAGGFSSPAMVRRSRTLAQETGLNVRVYGSSSADDASNLENVAAMVAAWADGADAFLPWQTLGSDKALDSGDAGAEGGAALLVPGDRVGLSVVGDVRLKAFRDGQQLIEYLTLLAEQRRLTREQVKAMIHEGLRQAGRVRTAGPAGDADSLGIRNLTAWDFYQIRRRVAELLVAK